METERGCGWRQIGGIYLVDDGGSVQCDGLPVELKTCPCCEFKVKQSRSMQAVHAGYLGGLMRGHDCHEDFDGCPLCYFSCYYHAQKLLPVKEQKKLGVPTEFYLMFVSKEFYTPESFVAEAVKQGISKRISPNSLPKNFRVGHDWVFLAHKEVPFRGDLSREECDMGMLQAEPEFKRAIFYAFKPKRLELLLWKGTDAQTIADYEQAGYAVVLIERTPENIERHGPPSSAKYPPLPHGFKRKRRRKQHKD